jgi:hypothetical protein
MVKRAKYIIKTTRHGDLTRQEITMVDPPDYPLSLGTSNPPFEQIKHLLSSRPYDMPEPRASQRGRVRKKRSR